MANAYWTYNIFSTLCAFCYTKKQLKSGRNLGEILQILSITLFEKTPVSQVLTEMSLQEDKFDSCNQLSFIDF